MKKNKLELVIESFRNYIKLKEDGVVGGGPTMSVGNGEKSLGYNLENESPPIKRKKKRIYIKGLRKWWKQNT